MKYTIELTNKQKAQMDCIIEIVHRYVGFNPKLEQDIPLPMKESPAYDKGYADGKADAIHNASLIDELKQVEYNKGLEDGYEGCKYLHHWFATACFYEDEDILFPEYKRREVDTCCLEDIITDVGFVEVLKRVKAYEEKKKSEEEIKVGDEVIGSSGANAIITMVDDEDVMAVFDDGSCGEYTKKTFRKTGRHFDEIEQLLDKLGGEKGNA